MIKPPQFRKVSSYFGKRGLPYAPHIQQLSSRQMDPKSWESTCVRSIKYDLEEQQLEIEFMQRGTFVYFDFEPWAFNEFNQAGSRGKYFNLYIRGRYEYERIA